MTLPLYFEPSFAHECFPTAAEAQSYVNGYNLGWWCCRCSDAYNNC